MRKNWFSIFLIRETLARNVMEGDCREKNFKIQTTTLNRKENLKKEN